MAVSTQAGNLAWQKVKHALVNANPSVQEAFRTLKVYLATQKGNPDLQFIPFADADLVQATGYSPVGAACTVYGVYFIKDGTDGTGNTTAMWLTVANEATNTTLALNLIALHTAIASQELFAVYPHGKAYGTDLTISAQDASLNGTEVASGAAGSGFVLIGNA